jgi:hypothetical protein
VLPATAAAPSGTKYAIAAIGGIAFALIVGGITVAVWMAMRPHAEGAIVAPEPAQKPAVTATATAAPPPVVIAAPSASTSTADQTPPPAPTTSTIDVTDLPTAQPTFRAPPPPRGWSPPPAAPTPAPTKPVALPANPY